VSGFQRQARGDGTYQVNKKTGDVRLVKRLNKKQYAGPWKSSRPEAKRGWNAKFASPSESARPSLSTFAKSWRAQLRGSHSTLQQWDLFLRNKLGIDLDELDAERKSLDPIGKMPLNEIDSAVVKAWLARQEGAPTTVRRLLGRLKQILKDAGIHVEVRRPADPGHARRPLSPPERSDLDQVLANADEPTRRAILIALYTGLRRSEICALRHSDRDGNGIWVRRRAIQTKGRVDVQPNTKTAKSRGWVPLPAAVREFIGPPRQGYVLTDDKEILTPVALTHRLKDAMRGTSIGKVPYAGLHTFRRTYGMILLEKGVDVATAAELMRHDPAMLLKEYARSREDLKVDAIKKAFGDDEEPSEGAVLGG